MDIRKLQKIVVSALEDIKGKDIQSELIQNYKVMLRGSTE